MVFGTIGLSYSATPRKPPVAGDHIQNLQQLLLYALPFVLPRQQNIVPVSISRYQDDATDDDANTSCQRLLCALSTTTSYDHFATPQ